MRISDVHWKYSYSTYVFVFRFQAWWVEQMYWRACSSLRRYCYIMGNYILITSDNCSLLCATAHAPASHSYKSYSPKITFSGGNEIFSLDKIRRSVLSWKKWKYKQTNTIFHVNSLILNSLVIFQISSSRSIQSTQELSQLGTSFGQNERTENAIEPSYNEMLGLGRLGGWAAVSRWRVFIV